MQDESMVNEENDIENENGASPIKAENQGNDEKKEKPRKYWDATEEEHFYEIWGRDNWLLTKHGKNTKFFAKWSEELKERFNHDCKPEEIQAKVNQTRAKFRQVKRNPKFNKQKPTWKKFHVIDKILKNKFRPADAEPIPPEALKKNRDVSPSSDLDDDEPEPIREQPPTPNSHASNSQDTITLQQQAQVAPGVIMSTDQMNNSTLDEHDISVNLFNANELQPNPEYDYIKEEFVTDYSQQPAYSTQYTADQNHFTTGMPDEPPQLLELQTPQQQFQHQMQPPQQQQMQPPQQQQMLHQPQQQQQQYNNVVAPPTTFDHHSVPNNVGAYSVSNAEVLNIYNNQQQHYNTTMAPSVPMSQPYNNVVAQPYMNNTSVTNTNSISNVVDNNINNSNTNGANNINNNGIMQPPRPTPQPRKRGRQPGSQTNLALAAAKTNCTDTTLETMYLDEVRKKNVILEEQKEIERKRLSVEERKVSLMEEFFPKCLEMQSRIFEKLLNIGKTEEKSPSQPE